MRCIKDQVKESEITFLVKPQYEQLVKSNPHVDEVMIWEGGDTISRLKAKKFDYVIDLHHNIRTMRIKKALSAQSYSFPKKNVQKWLKVNFKMDIMPKVHIVDRYFEAVRPIGVQNDMKGLEYHFENPLPPDLSEWNIKEQAFICCAIGGQFATKKMPDEKLIEVLQKIDLPIYLIGGKEDVTSGNNISEHAGDQVTSLCGQLTIDESAHIIKACKVLITHDTGMMHIGAALFKPVVSIWGNTTPEFGMYPYFPQNPEKFSIHEVNVKCRPCSKIGYQKCPKKHFKCMMNQDSQKIAHQAIDFFNKF